MAQDLASVRGGAQEGHLGGVEEHPGVQRVGRGTGGLLQDEVERGVICRAWSEPEHAGSLATGAERGQLGHDRAAGPSQPVWLPQAAQVQGRAGVGCGLALRGR